MKGKFLSFILFLVVAPFLISGCSQYTTEEQTNDAEAVASPSEVSQTLANPTTEDIDVRIAALKDEDKNVRANAAYELGIIGDARVVEPLIAALGDEDSFVRVYAAGALGAIGDERAVEPLIAAANSGLGENLASIISSLGLIGGDREYGNEDMAIAYLNCGNELLVNAAESWA